MRTTPLVCLASATVLLLTPAVQAQRPRLRIEQVKVGFLANPLLQPIFEGIILLLAVSLGAARVFRVKNRLTLFT